MKYKKEVAVLQLLFLCVNVTPINKSSAHSAELFNAQDTHLHNTHPH